MSYLVSTRTKKQESSQLITPDHKRKRDEAEEDPVLTFGKHRGDTYKDVLDTDQSYCFFALDQTEPTGGMLDFQQWLIPRIGQLKVQGPKFNGMEFERLRVEQSGYCDWVLKKDDATGWMKVLKQYLESKLDELWSKLNGEEKDEEEEEEEGEDEDGEDEEGEDGDEEEEVEYDEEEGAEEKEFFY